MDVSLPTVTLGSGLWTEPGHSQSALAWKGVHCAEAGSLCPAPLVSLRSIFWGNSMS